MLNKENYVPWSSRLLRYAKSRPNRKLIHNSILNGPYVRQMIPEPADANREVTVTKTFHVQTDDELTEKELKQIGKLIHNSILNGPYVRQMIPEPGDANREVTVTKTFHVQTDDEVTEKELKQIEADDQAIQTILLDLPEDIYAAVDSCETAQEIWLRVQQMMKGSNIGIQDKKAKLFNEWESTSSRSITFNQNYMQQPMPNPEDIIDPINAMNMGQDRQMQMVGGNGGNQFRQYARHNAGNLTGYNNVQNIGNQNQIGNGNHVAARAEENAVGQNGNQIRCYNCRGVGHYARNCTVRPRRMDAAYLQTQLLIAQKEEAGIQLKAEEYDLMAAAADIDEIEEV
nr:hypothetical protein [Tanacetum cinerariifolium]